MSDKPVPNGAAGTSCNECTQWQYELYTLGKALKAQNARTEKLKTENKRLREALEWIANGHASISNGNPIIYAKQALEGDE